MNRIEEDILMNISQSTLNWESLAEKALLGELLTVDEGLAILEAPDDELLPIMQASFYVRKYYFGKK